MALDGETARILRTILQLHQQRVQEYRRLDTAYRLLLQSRNAALYEKHCALVTAEFVRISNDVRANEALLRSVDPKIADIVRALQQSEGEKLAKTSEFQVAFQLWHRIRGEALSGGMLSPDIDTEDADDDELADVFPPAALASRTQSRLLTLKLFDIDSAINEHIESLQAELAQELADD